MHTKAEAYLLFADGRRMYGERLHKKRGAVVREWRQDVKKTRDIRSAEKV